MSLFKDYQPISSLVLFKRLIFLRCFGVDTDKAMTSPIASWNPAEKNKKKQCNYYLTIQYPFDMQEFTDGDTKY